ncbi:MAG: glycosyl transferase, family 9 [Actinomycetia bacterium]|nr:glycosyl transferase, family 9 [Actinomycetes bacterium]
MKPAHVLIARLDNTGDVLLAGPAVRAVAAGARRVTFVSSTGGREAAALLPGVDDILEFDAPWVGFRPPAVEPAAIDGFERALSRAGIDAAFVLTSSHQSPLPLALLLRVAGVAWIGASSVDYPGSLLDLRRTPIASEHEVERSLALVAAGGYRLPSDDDGALALRGPLPMWRPFERPYVVVHPGASIPARGYDADRAAAVVDLLVDDGWCVAVTGGCDERSLTGTVAGVPRPNVRDIAGDTDLSGLAGVMAGAAAVVCGNTGPAHLAAAVGTPVVSIFAPVVPAGRWRPWRVPTVLLGAQDIECAGCRARTCPVPMQPCLAAVTPAVVANAVGALVSRSEEVRAS